MKAKWVLLVVLAIFGIGAYAGNVLATPQSGFTTTQIAKGLFKEFDLTTSEASVKTKALSDVYVVRNTIAPGGQSGWHTHPGPSLVTVTAGEVVAYDGDDPTCTPKVYRAGEGFVDPVSDGHVHLLRNETNAPAETVAVSIVPKDAPRRIDAPDPSDRGRLRSDCPSSAAPAQR